MVTREQALERLQQDPFLARMYKWEEEQVLKMIDVALTFTDPINKPVYQEVLEGMVLSFVTSKRSPYYKAFAVFIDSLLPDMPDEKEQQYEVVYEEDGWLWVQ